MCTWPLIGTQSAHWINMTQDGDELLLCVGANITLPWQYQLSPGDVISDIQWLHYSLTEQVIAMVSNGHFTAQPAYSGNRVVQVTNAGIVVSNAAVSDTGRYSVEVQGHDASGNDFHLHHNVFVIIKGKIA